MPLIAALEEQLVPEADAEHRPVAPRQLAHRVAETRIPQGSGGNRERADPGEHHAVAREDRGRVALMTGSAPATWSARSTLRRLPTP